LIGNLVDDLINNTDADDLEGFVASEDKQIIGSIFFSRLIFQQVVNAFLLSLVAIHPEYQEKGIGQRLIDFGIEQLKKVRHIDRHIW
jgi:putative acetyltransferase